MPAHYSPASPAGKKKLLNFFTISDKGAPNQLIPALV